MRAVIRFVILPKLLADRFGGCILFGMEYLKLKMFYCKHQLMTENWYDKHLLKMCIKFNQVLSHFSNIVTADVTSIHFFEPVWFFYWGLSSHSRIFHSYGNVVITGEGLQILTYAVHSWPLSSEGSLACHIYCGTGHPFTMVFSEDPWHSHVLPSV